MKFKLSTKYKEKHIECWMFRDKLLYLILMFFGDDLRFGSISSE